MSMKNDAPWAFFWGYVVGVATVLLMNLGTACAPATKIGTGLDCWPESCAEKERREREAADGD
jgi:hypothetical protein